jgi:hypothetical protein
MNNLHMLASHLAVILPRSNVRKTSMDNKYTCVFSNIRSSQANSHLGANMCKFFMRGSLGILLLVAPLSTSLANCDLTQFRWLCKIPVQAKASHRTPSVINCGGTPVFVNRSQYEEIMRYQRASVNMTLKVNGEYVTSPCIPAQF